MSIHNIYLHGEIRKYRYFSVEKSALSGAMVKHIESCNRKIIFVSFAPKYIQWVNIRFASH